MLGDPFNPNDPEDEKKYYEMPLFVVLIQFTDRGIHDITQSPSRLNTAVENFLSFLNKANSDQLKLVVLGQKYGIRAKIRAVDEEIIRRASSVFGQAGEIESIVIKGEKEPELEQIQNQFAEKNGALLEVCPKCGGKLDYPWPDIMMEGQRMEGIGRRIDIELYRRYWHKCKNETCGFELISSEGWEWCKGDWADW